MNRIITLLLLPIFISGCGGSKESKQNKELEKLAIEVMEVHDRSMPNHGKLFKFKKQLLSIYENASDSIVKNEIDQTITDIDKSDDDMMAWMHTYEVPADYLPFEEKKTYYIEQKIIIGDVEILMNQTIDKSNQLIQKYSINK